LGLGGSSSGGHQDLDGGLGLGGGARGRGLSSAFSFLDDQGGRG
jgi:hypothetical protein